MHFRIRKNVVQLIRTTYDASKKKGVNTTVGAVKLGNPELTPELQRDLTAEEIAEFESWVKTQHRATMLREELAAMSLAETISQAEKWFEREGDSADARTLSTEIIFQWQSLRRLFAKHGLLD